MIHQDSLTGRASIDKPWLHFYEGTDFPEVPQQSIYDAISQCCDIYADKTAIEYFDTHITYRQMLNNIDRTADAYIAAGVRPGDYVSLCLLSTPECIYSMYALAKLGAISNFIEPRCNPKRILRHVNDTGSNILVIVDVFLDKLDSIKADLNTDKIIVVSLAESMSGLGKLSFRMSVKGRALIRKSKEFNGIMWDDFITDGVGAESFTAEYIPGSVACVVYTGGTTGLPKGAMITHDTFNTFMVGNRICNPHMYEADSFLNIMPPFIAYGLLFGQFMPYTGGLRCRLVPNFTPDNFDRLLLTYKPGCVIGVPSFFESMTTSSRIAHTSLDFLKCIITGGDKLPASTETMLNAFLKSHGCRTTILKGYGMTEMASVATFSVTPEAAPAGSVGIPIYFNNFMIVSEETGEELGYNCPGEICITGPSMTKGYVNNEAETRNLLHVHSDGSTWIHSGDIGYITEEGVLYIVDRKKRIIIRPDGHNVWPSLIEQTLLQHPAVSQCCTVGLPTPDSTSGKIPTAVIVLNKEFTASDELVDELETFSSMHLAERDMALDYKFIDAMPITAIGKVDYRALESKYSAQQ